MATAAIGMEEVIQGRAASRRDAWQEKNRQLLAEQPAKRRGPTPEMFFTKHIDNSRLVKTDDPVRKREMRVFSLVTSALFLLTMIYVWQHLAAIETGYRIEAAKQQLEQMREESRQLQLVEAQLSNPTTVDVAARELGMGAPMPGQVVGLNGGSSPAVASIAQPQGIGKE